MPTNTTSIALTKAKKDLTKVQKDIRGVKALILKENKKIIKRAAVIKKYSSQLKALQSKEKKLKLSIKSLSSKLKSTTTSTTTTSTIKPVITTTTLVTPGTLITPIKPITPITVGPIIKTGPFIKIPAFTGPFIPTKRDYPVVSKGPSSPDLVKHRKEVTALDDHYPVLLFPIRIETKFVGSELFIRVFPDEIFVKNLERDLTASENEESSAFWQSIYDIDASSSSNEEKETEKTTAVNQLISVLGKDRGAWALKATWPTNIKSNDLFSNKKLFTEDPIIQEVIIKDADWTAAAYTEILPDRFSFQLYDDKGDRVINQLGNKINTDIQLGFDPNKELVEGELYQEGLKWMFDYSEAVKVGLGASISLNSTQLRDGFSKLSVLGVKYSKNLEESTSLVTDLFENHQFKADGMGLVDIGTATENVENQDLEKSQKSELDTFIETHLRGDLAGKNELRTDVDRLVEALGLENSNLSNVENRSKVDISNSVEMGKVLWPSTVEYYLNQFSANTYSHTRDNDAKNFYLNNISGRGLLPTIRVGNQSYGVTAVSSFSHWRDSSKPSFGENLLESILNPLYQNIYKAKSQTNVSDAAEAYKALSANASSKHYASRAIIGKNIMTQMTETILSGEERNDLKRDLGEMGIDENDIPDIMEYSMDSEATALTGPIVDSGRVFSKRTLQDSEIHGDNIFGLIFKATSFTDIINHKFEGKVLLKQKDSLLYLYVRYAYLREAVKSSLSYLETDKLARAVALLDTEFDTLRVDKTLSSEMINYMSLTETSVVTSEPKFKTLMSGLNIKSLKEISLASTSSKKEVDTFLSAEVSKSVSAKMELEVPTSKWDYLNNSFTAVTGSASMGDFLFTQMNKNKSETADLKALRSALGNLKDLDVRELENLFSEHIDLSSHRLDSWLLGVVNERLLKNRTDSKYKTGLYFGAYGFVENLKKGKQSTTDELGFIHAPSRDQAKVAAIARSGFSDIMKEMLSDSATQSALNDLSIDITAKRIKTSLAIIDGINNGQDIRALLGFHFERGLSENDLARYILPFRNKYGTISSISSPGNTEDYKANNTVDGKSLIEAFQKSSDWSSELIESTHEDYEKIKEVLSNVDDSLDGFSDLMHVECLYQMVKADYAGLAAVLKSLNDFERFPEPEFIKTHVHALKHENRVALMFSEWGKPSMWGNSTYKSGINPWVNEWLGNLIPNHASILVHVKGAIEKSDNSIVLIDEVLSIQDIMSIEPIDLCANLPANNVLKEEFITRLVKLAISIREKNVVNWSEFNLNLKTIPGIQADQYSLYEVDFIIQQANTILKNGRNLLPKDLVNNIEKDDVDNNLQSDLDASIRMLKIQMRQIQKNLKRSRTLENYLSNGNKVSSPPRYYNLYNHVITSSIECNLNGFPTIDPIYSIENAEALLTFSEAYSSHVDGLVTSLKDEIEALTEPTLSEMKRILSRVTILGEYVTIPFRLKTSSELSKTYATQTFENITTDFKINDWLYTASKVKENLTSVMLLDQVPIGPKPILNLAEIKQLPYKKGESNVWMGTNYKGDVDSSRISLVFLSCESTIRMNRKMSGILVADWDEQIPIKEIDTGVAFNYDAPNAKSPKNILLGVSPNVTGKWDWDDMVGIIDETLALSKSRTVTLDDLTGTAAERFLPMTVAPVYADDESPSLNFLNNNE